jgi:hypothetical protein
MGSHTNSRAFNIIAIATTVVVIALSLTLLVQTVRGSLMTMGKQARSTIQGRLRAQIVRQEPEQFARSSRLLYTRQRCAGRAWCAFGFTM